MISSSDVKNASILIVDDQEANVVLLEQLLRSAGHVSITSTRNPREVCELHRVNRYSLILLDLQMPGMDGFGVMEDLRTIETDGYLPVLVVTAQPDHKLRALKAGARDFISKPFDFAEVKIRVYNMLEVRLLHMETKRLSDQLQSTNEELEAFSYSVSHDLRAPLRHVMGFVGMLREDAGPGLSEASLGHMATIAQAAKRMEILIDDLLAFSRTGRAALQKMSVDLNDLVRETVDDFQAQTKERKIVWTIHPLPPVRADPALLRVVLVKLISNAVKFTGARAEAAIEIGCTPDENGNPSVFIRDNGAGFDMAYAGKLFGAFQRLHNMHEYPGTGIGLATVQRIINRHGGRVWAESTVEAGATFHFTV